MGTVSEQQESRRAALDTAIARFIEAVEAQPDACFLHERAGRTPRDMSRTRSAGMTARWRLGRRSRAGSCPTA